MAIRQSQFIFFVRDQTASTVFYTRVLLRQPCLDMPGMTQFMLSPGCVLGLMTHTGISRILSEAVDPSAADEQPRAELYLMVEWPGAWQARAVAAGGRAFGPPAPRSWGHLVAYARDLDGYLLAFACPLSEAGGPAA